MKKLINILATLVLATSSAPYLIQKYVGDFQTTKYTEETQNYSLNEQNSNAFKQWASPGSGLDSWDQYLHNDVGNISGNTPYQPNGPNIDYQANVGGGVYLNLQNDTQSTFKQSYIDNQNNTHNAIGSYNYGSMNKSITQVDRSNELPQPPDSEAWESYFFNREPSAGYDLGTNNFAVNNLTPDNKKNDGVNRFLEGFLNTELNYWYYTNFSDVLGSLPDYNANLKHYTDLHRILVKYFEKVLKFTFGGKYNDLETTVLMKSLCKVPKLL